MQNGCRAYGHVVLRAFLATRAGRANDCAFCAERLIASATAKVRRLFRMLVTKSRIGRGRTSLMLCVFGKIKSAATAKAYVVFIFSGAAWTDLHEVLTVIMP